MSIPYDSATLLYAVVEHLPDSKHLCDPVDIKPERDGQYRLVCLTLTATDAWQMAPVLRALSDDRYAYTVCVAQPDAPVGEPLTVVDPARTAPTT
jgi:hypothetical protein